MKRSTLFVLGILLLFHIFLLSNLRFTAWPEMLSYPYLLNNGFRPYTDFIYSYPPLLTLFLAIMYKIFGYQLILLKFFTWGLILFSDLLIFLTSRRVLGRKPFALLSLVFCVLTQPFLEGNMLWFDLAIVPLVLSGALFFLNRRYFWSGLFLALAALTKQTAGLFIVFGGLLLFIERRRLKDLLNFFSAPALLTIGLGIYLLVQGLLGEFLNWVLFYPVAYWSKFPGYVQMGLTSRQWLILGLLITPLIFGLSEFWRQKILLLFFFISLILVYPRFSFFHFQSALAFLAILYAAVVEKTRVHIAIHAVHWILILAVIVLPVVRADWGKETRFWGIGDLALAREVAGRVNGSERVFLLGVHSGVYVLANRLPPKPWTDIFVWYLEIPGVQEKIIHRWEENPPAAVYWAVPKQGNWFDLGTYRPAKISDWIEMNYTRKGEIRSGIWLWETKS